MNKYIVIRPVEDTYIYADEIKIIDGNLIFINENKVIVAFAAESWRDVRLVQ